MIKNSRDRILHANAVVTKEQICIIVETQVFARELVFVPLHVCENFSQSY